MLDGLSPLPGVSFNRPVEVLSLSTGKAMIRLRQPVSSQALLALWDPSSNSLTNLTANAPVVFQQGVGVLARSGDHSRVLAAANDSSGELAVFDAVGNVVAGPRTLGAGLIQQASANQDVTRFAVIFASSGSTQFLVLDAALNQLGFYTPSSVRGVTFSRDGKYLYISETSSGLAMHPSGALLYQPFLTGAPGSAGVKGGVDILDAHSGGLRLRIFLPQQLMTDVDGLHGSFLATDENGQRLFAITSSDGTPQHAGLSIIQLASVPLGIGSVSPLTVSVSGGTPLTIRGSGFRSATTVSINGKPASVSFKDINMLTVVTPSLTPGPQRITITNPDGEAIALEAALTAN